MYISHRSSEIHKIFTEQQK